MRLAAVLRQRCPRCRRGRVFRGLIAMNETCPACRYRFEREPGYFIGAMYFSYALAVPSYALLVALSLRLLPGRPVLWSCALAFSFFLFLVPVIFRYSRVIWMHLDFLIHPESP